MNIALALERFPNEAALVGKILGSYTNLEVDLMNCVRSARQDLDTVLKAMFRGRGESGRVRVADAFGRQIYRALGLGQEFELAIGSMRYCIKIRNQYAHCIWWDDNSGRLAFANLEELAEMNEKVEDLRGLTSRHVDCALLEAQFAFFENASDYLMWLLHEGNRKSDRPFVPNLQKPAALPQPPQYI